MRSFSLSLLVTLLPLASALKQYSSGSVKSQDTFKFGKFKARIMGSDQKGTVASLFTFWEGTPDRPRTNAGWNEIDVEIVPSIADTTGAFWTNIIHSNVQKDSQSIANFNPEQNWHEYTIEWQPSFIAWSLDGVEVRRESSPRASVDYLASNWWKKQHLFMDFWTPEFWLWGNGLDDSQMPFYTRYDYVEAYDWDSSNGYTLKWRDDFDTLDTNRWNVANGWSYASNSSSFVRPNVYVKDGKLVLRMNKTGTDPGEDPGEPLPDNWPPPSIDLPLYKWKKPCDADDKANWGDQCQDCGDDECHASYPFGDALKFASPDVACRCMPKQRAAHGYTYKSTLHTNLNHGNCGGCDTCRKSYPINDPLKYKSDEFTQRCAPEVTFAFAAGECGNKYDGECGADCLKCSWGWPEDDTRRGGSPDAACRCAQIKELEWSEECPGKKDGDCGNYCKECRYSWFEYEQTNSDAVCRCRNWH